MKIQKKDTLRTYILAAVLTGLSLLLCSEVMALEAHQKIRGPFTSLSEVTETCLKCHHEKSLEVLQSIHWTWLRQRTFNGKSTLFDKKESLTNFAIDVTSNPSQCLTCHISTNRPQVDLDSPTPNQVDCLVCHDTTGFYNQNGNSGLNADDFEQLVQIARNAGKSSPQNCTTCHFKDCNLPAHNFQDTTAIVQDFHLENTKTRFSCQSCHTRHNGHGFSRKINSKDSPFQEEGCASCHSASPHVLEELNRHFTKVACQTCHIPEYAKQAPVATSWNWLMAGTTGDTLPDSPVLNSPVFNPNGIIVSRNMIPVYLWDDGTDQIYTRGQRIQPDELTYLQRPSKKNPEAKITPFRSIYGTQLYDAKYRYLISPLLKEDSKSYFSGSDWKNIAQKGMEAVILPFSGQFAFAPTIQFKRINHGIAPARDALDCVDCHGANSRMPWVKLGYDTDPWLEKQEKEEQEQKPSKSDRLLLQNFNQLSKR